MRSVIAADDAFVVSLIIPVCNVADYLSEALDSVIAQTWKPLEIIIVDDGSCDESGWYCDVYAKRDNRIRVIHQENQGLSSARNVGLDCMTGNAVAFLDPDDAMHPQMIELFARTMLAESADIVTCRYTSHRARHATPLSRLPSQSTSPKVIAGPYDRIGALRQLADETMEVAVWNKLYRRELWRDVRFPAGHVYEGGDTTFRVIDRCHRLIVLDDVLYAHRTQRTGSITSTLSEANARDSQRSLSNWASFVEHHVPDVFTHSQLIRVRRRELSGLIAWYALCESENSELDVWLRDCIRLLGSNIDMSTCPIRIRLGCWIALHCPSILRSIYPLYHRIRYVQLLL